SFPPRRSSDLLYFSVNAISSGLIFRYIFRKFTVFCLPLFAPAIQDANIFVIVVFQQPVGPGGKPVVIITIKHDGGIVADTGFFEQLFEILLGYDGSAQLVLQLSFPVPAYRPGNVSGTIGFRINVHFYQATDLISARVSGTVGGYECLFFG